MSDIKLSRNQIADIDFSRIDQLEEALSEKIGKSNLLAGKNITLTVDGDNITINSTSGGESSGSSQNVDLSDYYTKSESNNNFASKITEHTHNNKALLDLFTDSDGVLKYNGKIVPLNPQQFDKTATGTYIEETEIFNIKEICSDINCKALINGYLFLRNSGEITAELEEGQEDPNIATFVVYNNNFVLDTIRILPQQSQSYLLPNLISIKVKAIGTIYSEVSLVGYCY